MRCWCCGCPSRGLSLASGTMPGLDCCQKVLCLMLVVVCVQLESIAGREVSEDGPGYITSIEALNTSLSQPSQASQAAASTQVMLASIPDTCLQQACRLSMHECHQHCHTIRACCRPARIGGEGKEDSSMSLPHAELLLQLHRHAESPLA